MEEARETYVERGDSEAEQGADFETDLIDVSRTDRLTGCTEEERKQGLRLSVSRRLREPERGRDHGYATG